MVMRYCSGCGRETPQEADPHSRVRLGSYVWVDLRCRTCGLAEPVLEEEPLDGFADGERGDSSLFDLALELYRLSSDEEISPEHLRARGLELAYLLLTRAARREGRVEEMQHRLPGARFAVLMLQGAV